MDKLTQNQTLVDAVNKGKDKLDEIRIKIGASVNDTLSLAREKILEAGDSIQSSSKNITNIIVDLQRQIVSKTNPALDKADKYIVQYSPYRYYVGLAISCLLLLITICIALGLTCGICGKRPEGYGDDCCNKGAGSSFLIW